MLQSARRVVVRALVTVGVAVGAVLVAVGAGVAMASDLTQLACWQAVDDLAAAAVFADLPEEAMEQLYKRLDSLQEQCADNLLVDAARTIVEIEAVVGK